MHAMRVTVKLDDGEDEIFRFVERVKDFIPRDGDRAGDALPFSPKLGWAFHQEHL